MFMAEETSNWWTFHNASWRPGSSSTLHLLLSVLIKRSACLRLHWWDTHLQLFFYWVAPEFSRLNPLCAHSVGRAGLQNHCPHSDTCSGVRAIRFLGSVSATTLLLDDCRRRFLLPRIVYFPMDVQGTALGTLSCIDCGPLFRATHDIDSCEWSHRCLKHGPSAGYTSNLTVSIFSKVFVLLNMISMFIIVATSSLHVHIFVVTNLLLFF
jgi:hypothetical protein